MAHNGCVVLMDKKPSPNWVVIDAMGQSKEKYLNKSEVMDLVQINARDLRLLDLNLSYPSTILGRERAIVLNLEHIKAIITSKEVLLRLRNPSDEIIIPVVKEFQRRLPNEGEEDDSPFEFRALEVALEAICSFLAARTTDLETDAYPVLGELTSKISSRNLDRLRKLKGSMSRLIARVQRVRDELEKLLDDDDDMAHLYLSRATLSPYRGDENVVEEVESLLEAYFMQINSTLNKLTTLCEYIDDTEDYINIQLDNHRNQLLQLELVLSSLTVCSSLYSLVAGIFGMNIKYTWNNDHGYMFKHVVIITGIMCAVLFVIIMSYARYKGLVGS